MKIKKVLIEPSTRTDKRAVAILFFENGKKKNIHFGSPTAFTYYDGATDEKKENYLKRHSVINEKWDSPLTAGFWARYVNWSFRASSINKIIKLIKMKSEIDIPDITINMPTNKKPKSIFDYKFEK